MNVVAVDPDDPEIVYAGGDLEPHASRCTAARSTDGGATWSCMTPQTQSDFTSDFTDLVIDPRDPRILYALFSGVFHRSADRGQTWTVVAPRSHAIGHLTLDPSRRNRFYALSRIGPGVLRSDNGGRSWISVTAGLPENSFVHDLLLDPTRPDRVWIAVEIFEIGQVGKSTSRIFRSDEAGNHWTEVSAGLAAGDVVLHLAADPRAGRRPLRGHGRAGAVPAGGGGVTSWSVIASPVASCSLVLLGLSASSAPTWGARWEALPLWGGEVRLAAAADLSVVYAAAPNGGLYQSTNGGLTWQFIANGPPGHFDLFLKVDPFAPRRLYIKGWDPLTFFYHLYRSEDGGRRWQRSDAGFAADSVADFALDPSTPGLVYAATSAGVFRSRNRGISWSRISDLRLHRIAVTPRRSGRPARRSDPERSGVDAAEHR